MDHRGHRHRPDFQDRCRTAPERPPPQSNPCKAPPQKEIDAERTPRVAPRARVGGAAHGAAGRRRRHLHRARVQSHREPWRLAVGGQLSLRPGRGQHVWRAGDRTQRRNGPTDEGALFAEDSTNTTADIPNGADAGWRFTAPVGTSIAGLTYWRSLHAYDQQSLVPGLWTGEGATLESCQSTTRRHPRMQRPAQQPRTADLRKPQRRLAVLRCSLQPRRRQRILRPAGPGERHAQADLYSATVTLSETSVPTVSSVSGAGWSGGVISGQVPLTLTADDPSGIADVEVRSTLGAVLATAPQSV